MSITGPGRGVSVMRGGAGRCTLCHGGAETGERAEARDHRADGGGLGPWLLVRVSAITNAWVHEQCARWSPEVFDPGNDLQVTAPSDPPGIRCLHRDTGVCSPLRYLGACCLTTTSAQVLVSSFTPPLVHSHPPQQPSESKWCPQPPSSATIPRGSLHQLFGVTRSPHSRSEHLVVVRCSLILPLRENLTHVLPRGGGSWCRRRCGGGAR